MRWCDVPLLLQRSSVSGRERGVIWSGRRSQTSDLVVAVTGEVIPTLAQLPGNIIIAYIFFGPELKTH